MSEENCAICLEKTTEMFDCKHHVHLECAKKHFKPECPVCRAKVNIRVSGTYPNNYDNVFEEVDDRIYRTHRIRMVFEEDDDEDEEDDDDDENERIVVNRTCAECHRDVANCMCCDYCEECDSYDCVCVYDQRKECPDCNKDVLKCVCNDENMCQTCCTHLDDCTCSNREIDYEDEDSCG